VILCATIRIWQPSSVGRTLNSSEQCASMHEMTWMGEIKWIQWIHTIVIDIILLHSTYNLNSHTFASLFKI
jgi:hypothetical protein